MLIIWLFDKIKYQEKSLQAQNRTNRREVGEAASPEIGIIFENQLQTGKNLLSDGQKCLYGMEVCVGQSSKIFSDVQESVQI